MFVPESIYEDNELPVSDHQVCFPQVHEEIIGFLSKLFLFNPCGMQQDKCEQRVGIDRFEHSVFHPLDMSLDLELFVLLGTPNVRVI